MDTNYELDFENARYFKWFKDEEQVMKAFIVFGGAVPPASTVDRDESQSGTAHNSNLVFDMTLKMDEENYKLAKGIHPDEDEVHIVDNNTFLKMPKGAEVEFGEGLQLKTWYNFKIEGAGKRIYQLSTEDIESELEPVATEITFRNDKARYADLASRLFVEELEAGRKIKMIKVKHPDESCNRKQEEVLATCPLDQRRFHELLFTYGNITYRYHHRSREFNPTEKEYHEWDVGMDEYVREKMGEDEYAEYMKVVRGE